MNTSRWLLLLLLLLAAALRLVDLENTPPPFNVDEALHAYDAYSILKTGKDQWGNALPITIRAFNDYRRPAAVYTAVPFIAVLNLSIFAIRAMAAFWGWWAIVFVYRLTSDMFGRRTALFAVLMFAISPWHVVFSRLGVEASGPLLTCITAALDFGWRWYRTRKNIWIILSGSAFGLSFYTYTITQAFTPVMLLALTVIFWSYIRTRLHIGLLTAMLIIIIALPLVNAILSNPLSWNRFETISVLKSPYIESISKLIMQWVGYFTPNFLFLNGDANPIHHPPGSGQLLWIDTLFVPSGVVRLLFSAAQRRRTRQHKPDEKRYSIDNLPFRASILIVVWIVLGSLPAALTKQDMGSANAMRGILSLPAWIILSSIGLNTLWGIIPRLHNRYNILRFIPVTILLINAFIVHRYYYAQYSKQHARHLNTASNRLWIMCLNTRKNILE